MVVPGFGRVLSKIDMVVLSWGGVGVGLADVVVIGGCPDCPLEVGDCLVACLGRGWTVVVRMLPWGE